MASRRRFLGQLAAGAAGAPVLGSLLSVQRAFAEELDGRWVAVTLSSLLLGLVVGPCIELLPLGTGFGLWVLAAVVPTVLYLRYGLLAALVAMIVSRTVPASLPLLLAQDSTIQAQGWIAIAVVSLPLVLSVASIGRGTPKSIAIQSDLFFEPAAVQRLVDCWS